MSKTIAFWFQTIVLILLPALLMSIWPSFMAIRAYVMGVGAIYLFYVLKVHHVTWADLGLQSHHFLISLKKLIIPSLVLIVFTLLLLVILPPQLRPTLIGSDSQIMRSIYWRIFLYSVWSVPFQELLFRGYLVWKLKTLGFQQSKIFLLALFIFTLVHLPFQSPLMIIVALYLGYIYLSNYLKYGNIFSLMISHAIVGSILILIRNYYLPY